jgi:N-acetylmuramoyl-L-alanine amidase
MSLISCWGAMYVGSMTDRCQFILQPRVAGPSKKYEPVAMGSLPGRDLTGHKRLLADRLIGRWLVLGFAALLTSACAIGSGSPAPAGVPRPVAGSRHVAGGSGVPAGISGGPLSNMIVGIDPGHNGGNFDDPSYINHLIWNGREEETCDTTGTETDSGYSEARFNFNVATFLRADLRADGARVVMTRRNDHGVGPCVTRRAEIINHAHADVAVDIHADGGPAAGRGFAILEPVADGPNDKVIRSSIALGRDIRHAFLARTSMPVSTYDGTNGVKFRDDLAGLNLTRVPKVLIECGNMRNATDARLLTSTAFQKRIARVLEAAIIRFLRARVP